MAKANFLIPGFQYRITSGLLAEEIVTVIDNHTMPDCENVQEADRLSKDRKHRVDSAHKLGQPHNCTDPEGLARKILVKFEDGNQDYILPRLLSDEPMGIDSPAIQGAPVQQVAQTIQDWAEDQPLAPVHTTLLSQTEDMATIINPATGLPITVPKAKVTPLDGPMDPRLDHLRPSREVLKHYISRTMLNGAKDTDVLVKYCNDFYRAKNQGYPASFMLKGDTQGGKTLLIQVLAVLMADAMGYPKPLPIFLLSGSSGVTDYDLFGQPVTYTDPDTGTDRLVNLPGVVSLAAQVGGLLYLDEINFMGERVTSSLHSLTDYRHHFMNRGKAVLRGGVFMPEFITAHQDLVICGTYNDGNYRGAGEMNEAFINRFRHIRWDYDADVEAQLIESPAVRLLGEALRNARRNNFKGFRTPVGTAALMRLEEDIQEMGLDLGLEIFFGMFKHTEYDVVKEIIDVRIKLMLEEEVEQARLNAANIANAMSGMPDLSTADPDDLLAQLNARAPM